MIYTCILVCGVAVEKAPAAWRTLCEAVVSDAAYTDHARTPREKDIVESETHASGTYG